MQRNIELQGQGFYVANLISQMRDSFRFKLRQTLSQFKTNAGVIRAMQRFYMKIMDSNLGRSIKVFQRWKSMPDRPDDQKIINTNKFERKLTQLHQKRVKASLDAFKEKLYKGEGVKIGAVRTLLIKT